MSIKRGYLVLTQGANVKAFAEASGASAVLRTYASSNTTIGTSTGQTVTASGVTWLLVLVPDAVSPFVRQVYLDEEFLTGKTNPDYDYQADEKPSSDSTNGDGMTTGTGGGSGSGSGIGSGTTVYDTQKGGTIPVKLDDGKTIYVKVSLPATTTGSTIGAGATDEADSKVKKWLTYGFGAVLVAVVVALVIVLTRKAK